MKETTPWSMLGGRGGCTKPILPRLVCLRRKVQRVSELDFRRQKEFAEPVTLSSTWPTDLPVARTAFEPGFDLLASRARRSRESRRSAGAMQEVEHSTGREKIAICAEFNYPHFHSLSCSLWKETRSRPST